MTDNVVVNDCHYPISSINLQGHRFNVNDMKRALVLYNNIVKY